MRWRLDIEYDGTDFSGWQIQPGERTIQGELERALAEICIHPVRVSAAGRTDAGVHALQQVTSFVTEVERTPKAIVCGLNRNLPDDVAATSAQIVPDVFDPRRNPHEKTYRYRWLDRGERSPLRRKFVWRLRREVDVDGMNAAAASLLGEHDFTSFRAAGCSATHPIRTLDAIRVERRDDEVVLEVEGRAFLRHMVRNIAGTLYEVGRGKFGADHLARVLAARDRSRAGATAPPQGLVLASIRYF